MASGRSDFHSSCVGENGPMHIDKVNAHLRVIPRDPSYFRVVLTFHRHDGSLGEATLNSVDAAELLLEIGGAIEQGMDICWRGRSSGRKKPDGDS